MANRRNNNTHNFNNVVNGYQDLFYPEDIENDLDETPYTENQVYDQAPFLDQPDFEEEDDDDSEGDFSDHESDHEEDENDGLTTFDDDDIEITGAGYASSFSRVSVGNMRDPKTAERVIRRYRFIARRLNVQKRLVGSDGKIKHVGTVHKWIVNLPILIQGGVYSPQDSINFKNATTQEGLDFLRKRHNKLHMFKGKDKLTSSQLNAILAYVQACDKKRARSAKLSAANKARSSQWRKAYTQGKHPLTGERFVKSPATKKSSDKVPKLQKVISEWDRKRSDPDYMKKLSGYKLQLQKFGIQSGYGGVTKNDLEQLLRAYKGEKSTFVAAAPKTGIRSRTPSKKGRTAKGGDSLFGGFLDEDTLIPQEAWESESLSMPYDGISNSFINSPAPNSSAFSNGNGNAARANNAGNARGNGNVPRTNNGGNVPRANGNGNATRANNAGNALRANGNGNVPRANGNGNTARANGNGNVPRANGNGNVPRANGNGISGGSYTWFI